MAKPSANLLIDHGVATRNWELVALVLLAGTLEYLQEHQARQAEPETLPDRVATLQRLIPAPQTA